MRRRIRSYIWAVLFVLSMTMSAAGMTVNAASPKTVKTVTVRADEKNVTQKTYTLEIGKSKSLKVKAKPTQAVESIRYQSNSRDCDCKQKGKSDCKEKRDCKNPDYSYGEKQKEKIHMGKGKIG